MNFHFPSRNNFSEKNFFNFIEQNSCLKDYTINGNIPVQLKGCTVHGTFRAFVSVKLLLSTCNLNVDFINVVFIFDSSTEFGEEGGSCLD